MKAPQAVGDSGLATGRATAAPRRPMLACTLCHGDLASQVRHELLESVYLYGLACLAPFAALVAALWWAHRYARRREASAVTPDWQAPAATRTTAALALGMGLGGFVDGIAFHQLLQVHGMLSARIPIDTLVGAKVNMVWDGIFHAGVWGFTVFGLAWLWRAGRAAPLRDGRGFVAALSIGWGAFNLIEGVIDHHLLQLHHVYERAGQSFWDYAFLAWGAAMLLVGAWLRRGRGEGRRDPPPRS